MRKTKKNKKNQQKQYFNKSLGTVEKQVGVISAHFGQRCEVQNAQQTRFNCFLRQTLPPLVTGDEVEFLAQDQDNGVVESVLPRRSSITRTLTNGKQKLIAANIDQALLVIATQPSFESQLIDRYLVNTSLHKIPTVLVFNKSDLLSERQRQQEQQRLAIYQQLEYPLLWTSSVTGEGLAELEALMAQQTSVCIGQSGVGKSSLIQQIMPQEQLRVGQLSSHNNKGQHTTTTARLYALNQGGRLIDSPGIRDLPLTHLQQTDIAAGFREFQHYLGQCKFIDCQHLREPGCAIQNGLRLGHIAAERYASYCRIVHSL